MPFFSGGRNDCVLFAYGEHFYILYSIKNCTNDGGKKDSFFVNIHNCFLLPDIVLYTQKAGRKPAGGESPRCTLKTEHNSAASIREACRDYAKGSRPRENDGV